MHCLRDEMHERSRSHLHDHCTESTTHYASQHATTSLLPVTTHCTASSICIKWTSAVQMTTLLVCTSSTQNAEKTIQHAGTSTKVACSEQGEYRTLRVVFNDFPGPFFATLSAIVSRDPHVTGDLAEYNCFTRVCESAVCCKIFIKCILGVTGLYISYSQWHSSNQKSLSVVYKEYVLMTLISNVR